MIGLWQKTEAGSVPALFLHIQKTAGTSISNLARQYYGNSLTSHGDCYGKSQEQLEHIGFISGHLGYHFLSPLMDGRFTFTFLRDPAERILSMYYYSRSCDPDKFEIYKMANEMDLPTFLQAGFRLPCVQESIWNNQVWQIAHGYGHLDDRAIDDFTEDELLSLAKMHIDEFSYVGFTETFATDMTVVLKALGIPKPKKLPVYNAMPDRPKVAEQSSDVKYMLDRLTELDRELYEYVWKRSSAAKSAKSGGWRLW
jgi:hypothetical protein